MLFLLPTRCELGTSRDLKNLGVLVWAEFVMSHAGALTLLALS